MKFGLACAPLTALRRLPRFLRVSLSRASGSLIAVAALLGSARATAVLLEKWTRGGGEPLKGLYRLVPSEVMAGCMLVAVLIAEQCVRHGARRLTAYAPAIIVAAAASGLIATPLVFLMYEHGIPMSWSYAKIGALGTALHFSADALARGGLAAFVYANRESLMASMRQLRTAELERAQAERDLAKSHLLEMEAIMQPEGLIATLKAVRRLYEEDRGEADSRLTTFIEHLRSMTLAKHS